MPKKKTKAKVVMTEAQKRNALIFRLRGFYANAQTLPFNKEEINSILHCVDFALKRQGATTQTAHEGIKS